MRKSVLTIALAPLIASCAASGPMFTDATPPEQGKALIYVYRAKTFAMSARSSGIVLDGQDVCDLDPLGYCYFYVSTGHHMIQQRWHYWPGDLALPGDRVTAEVDAREGETHYFSFTTNAHSAGYQTMEFQWWIKEVPEGSAKAEIAEMHYQPYKEGHGLRF